jgi:DNA-binding MarR family transcriptional regulator
MASEKTHATELRLIEEIGMLIRLSRRRVWAHVSKCLEDNGESPLVWPVLACLVHMGPCTQREIAERMSQHPAGVSRLLDDLEARRLVRRTRDATDRRKVRVEATALGRARVEAVHKKFLAAVDHALRGLTHEDRVTLRDLLKKVVETAGEDADARSVRAS